jgi:hypothetical protein
MANPTTRREHTAGEIAEMASRGEDVSAHFTNRFTVVGGVLRDHDGREK